MNFLSQMATLTGVKASSELSDIVKVQIHFHSLEMQTSVTSFISHLNFDNFVESFWVIVRDLSTKSQVVLRIF